MNKTFLSLRKFHRFQELCAKKQDRDRISIHIFLILLYISFPKVCSCLFVIKQYVLFFLNFLNLAPFTQNNFFEIHPCYISNVFLFIFNIIILYGYPLIFIHLFTYWGHLGCFQFLIITSEAAENIHVQSLYGCMLSFPWGKYLEVEMMGFYSGLCLTYYETAQLFSKVFVSFYIPPCSV